MKKTLIYFICFLLTAGLIRLIQSIPSGIEGAAYAPLLFGLFLLSATFFGLGVFNVVLGVFNYHAKPQPLLTLVLSLIFLVVGIGGYTPYLRLPLGVPLVCIVLFIILFVGRVISGVTRDKNNL